MSFNPEKIRRANNRKLKQYERFGIPIFLQALKDQATPTPSIIPMQNAYVEFYQKVFVDAAKTEWNRIRMQEKAFIPSDFFLNTWREWIRTWVIENLYDLISEVTANTLKKVEIVLADAINRGLNPTQTQELLVKEIGDVKRARAIARTESTRANNEGKKKSAEDYARETGQVLFKVWIWGGSREPRIEHFELQNKPIRSDLKFVGINGLLMDKPGDRSGGPENTVNCSCSVVYLSERLARRRFPDAFKDKPIQPIISFPEPIFKGDSQVISKFKNQATEIIKELGITRQIEFDFSNKKGNFEGSVSFVFDEKEKAYKIGSKVIVKPQFDDNEFLGVLKHELRHVYQADFKGFMVKNNTFYYDGEPIMKTSTYNKILSEASKSKKGFEKYINLPWEKDADKFAGIIRPESMNKDLIVDEFFIIDLIELPDELQGQE